MNDNLILFYILLLFVLIIIDKIFIINLKKELEKTKFFNALIFTYLKGKKDFIEFNKEHNIDIKEVENDD